MKHIIYLILITLFPLAGIGQDKIELLDSFFNTMHQQNRFSGNALVVFDGKLIYNKSFGLADREQNISLSPTTLFNTSSVSMTFTAVAILQLAEKGKLDLYDPIVKYLPKFPYKQITISNLLSHSSGLPSLDEILPEWEAQKLLTNNDVMTFLSKEKPKPAFDPGIQALFNDVGYIVLAKVVESVSNMTFSDYLNERIFKLAGMNQTSIFNADQIRNNKNAAKGYLFSPFSQKYEEAVKTEQFGKLYSKSGTYGDGNIWSTTEDLLKFCMAIADETLLNEESTVSMFLKKKDAVLPGNKKLYRTSFGFGWLIPEAPYRIAHAMGDIPGFNSSIIWNISENRLIIYLSNDYLSFTSYNNILPYAAGAIVNQDILNIPRKYASIELTNEVLHISNSEIEQKIDELKADTVNIDFDLPGFQFLVSRLKDMGEEEKAALIEKLIYQ